MRYKGAFGGRGSGKSWFFAELAVAFCLLHPVARIVCVREVQKSLRESVKLLLEDRIRHFEVSAHFGITDKEIRTPGGGIIMFQGMQDHTAESIKSLEGFDIAYVEEAQTLTERSLEFLRPTIRRDPTPKRPGSELWFSWNPRSAADPVDAFLRGPNPPADAVVVRTSYRDNPFFPAVLEEERAYDEINNPVRYAHIWEGEYEPMAAGAIWNRLNIHQNRRSEIPRLTRIVVAVDPAVTAEPGSNEHGIIVAALGEDGRGYILEDASMSGSPHDWATRAIAAYDAFEADAIVAEVNQGGDMVRHTLHSVRPGIRVIQVRAMRGKHVRAEPISSLYALGKVSHVGAFPELEGQMCLEAGTLIETHRGQVPVELVTVDDLVMTRKGFAPLQFAGYTGVSERFIELRTANSTLRTTECHPIFLAQTNEFASARSVRRFHRLLESPNWASTARPSHGVAGGGMRWRAGITAMLESDFSIAAFTGFMSAFWGQASSFIMSMMTPPIIGHPILRPLLALDTMPTIAASDLMYSKANEKGGALFAGRGLKPSDCSPISIAQTDVPKSRVGDARPVYNLSVSDGHLPEFYANGILVHNCQMTAAGYEGHGSPDRVDALVWGLTELFPKLTRRTVEQRGGRPMATNSAYNVHGWRRTA